MITQAGHPVEFKVTHLALDFLFLMGHLMLLPVALKGEGFVTMITSKDLFSMEFLLVNSFRRLPFVSAPFLVTKEIEFGDMRVFVMSHLVLAFELPSANVARKVPFFRMFQLVVVQEPLRRRGKVATWKIAGERPLSGMNLHMPIQDGLIQKAFTTDAANDVRRSMVGLVTLQSVLRLKRTLTPGNFAFKSGPVTHDVFAQNVLGFICHAANLASFFRLAVLLLMIFEQHFCPGSEVAVRERACEGLYRLMRELVILKTSFTHAAETDCAFVQRFAVLDDDFGFRQLGWLFNAGLVGWTFPFACGRLTFFRFEVRIAVRVTVGSIFFFLCIFAIGSVERAFPFPRAIFFCRIFDVIRDVNFGVNVRRLGSLLSASFVRVTFPFP